jgi:hypothetical protein
MAKHNIKDPKSIACIVLACIGFPALIVLFTMGGVFYAKEHPKVLDYANSMCRVDSRSYKTYQCKTRYYQYSCYGPIWEAHYGENRTIFALVEGEKRYRSYIDAFNKAQEYNVSGYQK